MTDNIVQKGWGKETIFASNELYAGKFLEFTNAGNKMSMHFHKNKDESWVVMSGAFILRYIDITTAKINESILRTGDTWRNPPLLPHQLEALENGSIIIEVSTADDSNDNYRVMPGDSQDGNKQSDINF
jgi:mannose-6-phosphate isomerase-like protein (cupin superfamily)